MSETRQRSQKWIERRKPKSSVQLNEEFGKAGVVVVARYQGMTVADMSKLRSQMRAVGANFKVSKNRLAKRAAEGTMAKPMQDLLKGPTGIAFSTDPIAAPKAAFDYAKTNAKFVILGRRRRRPVLGRERRRGFGLAALAQRTPGASCGHAQTARDESREHSAGAGRAARPRHRRLCQERRSGVIRRTTELNVPRLKHKQGTYISCPNSKKSLMNSPR